MIQRIQTIFLLLVTLLSSLFFFIPFQKIIYDGIEYNLTINSGFTEEMVKPLILLPFSLNSLIVIISLATVFLYKNRALQMKLCTILAILSCILCISLVAIIYIKTNTDSKFIVTYNFYAILPAINIILAFIAKRFVKNDDELVKSADRIR